MAVVASAAVAVALFVALVTVAVAAAVAAMLLWPPLSLRIATDVAAAELRTLLWLLLRPLLWSLIQPSLRRPRCYGHHCVSLSLNLSR